MSSNGARPPEGYHYKWRSDPHWKYDPGKRKCRQVKCGADAVAALNRGLRVADGTRRDSWWYYCADHLYGRRIMHGKVKTRYLVPNASC